MDHDPIFNMSRGNGQPIEGVTYRLDVNALEDQYQQERNERSEFQRLLRQHNRISGWEDFGFAGYDPALEDRYRSLLPQIAAAEPIEERPEVLRRFSTVHDPSFRRYITPPTTPELPAIRPVGHDIAPPHPDLLLNTPRHSDRIWYGPEFYAQTMCQDYQHRVDMHPLEKSFICNKLGLVTEVLLLVYRTGFPLVPWSDDLIRSAIEQARWQAKLYIWKAEEVNLLRKAALHDQSEEKVWLALRAKWPYYPKDRRAVSRKYRVVQQEVALGRAWQRYDEGQQLMADALAQGP